MNKGKSKKTKKSKSDVKPFSTANEIAAVVYAVDFDKNLEEQFSEIYDRMDGNAEFHMTLILRLADMYRNLLYKSSKTKRRMNKSSSEAIFTMTLPGMEEFSTEEKLEEQRCKVDELGFSDDVSEYLKSGKILNDSEQEKRLQEEWKEFSDDNKEKQKALREARQLANESREKMCKIERVISMLRGLPVKKKRKPKSSGHSMIQTDPGIPRLVFTISEEMENRPSCPECSSPMRIRSYQEINELVYIPINYLLITKRVPIYSCPNECVDEHDRNVPCVRAEFEDHRLFEKSMATPGLIAGSVSDLILGHTPLSNQEKRLRELGANIGKKTLNNWHMRTAESYLKPVFDRVIELMLDANVLEMDETPQKIRIKYKKEGKIATRLKAGYIFSIMTGAMENFQLAAYLPSVDRSLDVLAEILENGFSGTVLADGYKIYDQLNELGLIAKRGNDIVHFRREVFDGYINREDFKELKRLSKKPDVSIEEIRLFLWQNEALLNILHVVALIQRLFEIEDRCDGNSTEEIVKMRQRFSAPVMDQLTEAAAFIMENFEEGSVVWKAINYFWTRREAYRMFLEDGQLSIHTNRIEGIGIRNFTLLRKNVMFSNSLRGAYCTCIYMTLMTSARLNGLDPYRYLEYLLTELMKYRPEGAEQSVMINTHSTLSYEGTGKSQKQKDKKIVQNYKVYQPFDFEKELIDRLLPCSKELPDYLKAGYRIEHECYVEDTGLLEVLLQQEYNLTPKTRPTLEELLSE